LNQIDVFGLVRRLQGFTLCPPSLKVRRAFLLLVVTAVPTHFTSYRIHKVDALAHGAQYALEFSGIFRDILGRVALDLVAGVWATKGEWWHFGQLGSISGNPALI
jgi:hypothetical protein